MKNIVKGLIASALLLPAAAFADSISYSYAQGGYSKITTTKNGVDLNSDGWYAGGSFLVAPNVFVFGSYSDVQSDDIGASSIESKNYNAGLGLRAPVTDYMDVNLAAAYVHSDPSFNGPAAALGNPDNGSGYSVSLGLRTALGKWVELDTGYNYVDVNNSQSSFDVGGLINITKWLAITAAYRFGDGNDAWTAGGRINFMNF